MLSVSSQCSFFYKVLCVIGLIVQIGEVSKNYFEYQVIKDIDIIMPEDMKHKERVIVLCLHNEEVLDIEKYTLLVNTDPIGQLIFLKSGQDIYHSSNKNYFLSYLTVKQRLDLRLNVSILFSFSRSVWIKEFILGQRFCYQINQTQIETPINRPMFANVTELFVGISAPIPNFVPKRLDFVSNVDSWNDSFRLDIQSYLYSVVKLSAPYVEKCINYSRRYSLNKASLQIKCVNEQWMKQSHILHRDYPITLNDTDLHNYKTMFYQYLHANTMPKEEFETCMKKYLEIDCDRQMHFSKAYIRDSRNKGSTMFSLRVIDNDASYFILSKPRIGMIDFVTYVLGALGSWVGFSFIALNPVPFICKCKERLKGPPASPADQKSEMRHEDLKLDMVRLKLKVTSIEKMILDRSKVQHKRPSVPNMVQIN